MIRLIVFDWDDTFTLDSMAGYLACCRAGLSAVGVEMTDVEIWRRLEPLWGQSHVEELRALLAEYPERHAAAVAAYETAFFGDVFTGRLGYVEGANDMLRELARGFRLAIATGAHIKVLKERVFPQFAVPDVFAQVMSVYEIDDHTRHKPHPYMLEEIMAGQEIGPGQTIMVGDGGNDVRMALAAGVRPVVVLTGSLTRESARALGVPETDIIPQVTDLPEWLRLHGS